MNVTFMTLSEGVHKKIAIRGFVICPQEGLFLLSSLPNVKSCCVHKNGVQILLDLENHFLYETPLHVVTATGVLSQAKDGTYCLERATLMDSKR